jgi:ficolin
LITDNAIVVQQNFNGRPFFDRSWAEFKAGFGDVGGDYWIGNERLHEITEDGRYKIHFDLLSAGDKQWYWAEYSTFVVGAESTNYTLRIDGYSGTSGNAAGVYTYAGEFNPNMVLNGTAFTTRDRDNDQDPDHNCANWSGIIGGFWYNHCGYVLINSADESLYGFSWIWITGQLHNIMASRAYLLPL